MRVCIDRAAVVSATRRAWAAVDDAERVRAERGGAVRRFLSDYALPLMLAAAYVSVLSGYAAYLIRG